MKKKLVIAAVCLVLIVGAGAFWVLGGAGRGPGDSLALDDNATEFCRASTLTSEKSSFRNNWTRE